MSGLERRVERLEAEAGTSATQDPDPRWIAVGSLAELAELESRPGPGRPVKVYVGVSPDDWDPPAKPGEGSK